MEIVAKKQDFVAADPDCWKTQLKRAIREPNELLAALDMPLAMKVAEGDARLQFPVFCPQPFLERIEKGNPKDPLFRQVWPDEQENQSLEGNRNPLREDQFELAPGVLQKYASRALLITTGACAIHCRYCFRRFFPYQESPKSMSDWEGSIEKIEQDPSIDEVVLSGGDPLTMPDEKWNSILQRLSEISQLRRIRIHSRLPIVIPSRITAQLLEIFKTCPKKIVMVIHSNHANELDQRVQMACHELKEAGVLMLNQTVLLRGINDCAETLIALSERLVELGVTPYYLHKLDPVAGGEHFDVSLERGQKIISEMRDRVSGYLVPRFVQEQPGEAAKTIIA